MLMSAQTTMAKRSLHFQILRLKTEGKTAGLNSKKQKLKDKTQQVFEKSLALWAGLFWWMKN